MGEKKEKITYIDDGRTIADMSGVSRGFGGNARRQVIRPSFKEVWKTYWNAVRMMLFPMLVAIGALVVIFLILLLVFSLQY